MARPLQFDFSQFRNAQLSIMVWLEFRKKILVSIQKKRSKCLGIFFPLFFVEGFGGFSSFFLLLFVCLLFKQAM